MILSGAKEFRPHRLCQKAPSDIFTFFQETRKNVCKHCSFLLSYNKLAMHLLVDARRVKSVVLKYFLGTCLIEENCLVFGACNLLQTALCSVGE